VTACPLILLTRPAGPADPLIDLLVAHGYAVAAVPTIAIRPAPPEDALGRSLSAGSWDWVVVTSAAGARAVAAACTRINWDRSAAPGTRWAAVGPGTAAVLRTEQIRPDLVARDPSGLGLAADMTSEWDIRGARVLLARGDAASSDLPSALRAAGADVHDVVAYRTVEAPPESAAAMATALADHRLAGIVVASGTAARGLVRLALEAGLTQRVRDTPLISIGPRTSAVIRGLGLDWIVEAAAPTPSALMAAITATASPQNVPQIMPRRL